MRVFLRRTCDPPIKVGVGGHFEAGVGHQEAGDVGEAGVDVFTHVLQLLVLVLRDLRHKRARAQRVSLDWVVLEGSVRCHRCLRRPH